MSFDSTQKKTLIGFEWVFNRTSTLWSKNPSLIVYIKLDPKLSIKLYLNYKAIKVFFLKDLFVLYKKGFN